METLVGIFFKRLGEMFTNIASDYEATKRVGPPTPVDDQPLSEIPAPGASAAPPPPAGQPNESPATPPPTNQPSATPPPAGVELDSAGLPWDARIHAASKMKLAKGGGWKKKRGVDKALVESVEAELRAVMAAQPNESPATPPPTNQPSATPPPAAATGAVTTFPELVAKVTGAGLDADTITTVCKAHGVESFALLGARPDLIPAIAASLFPGE